MRNLKSHWVLLILALISLTPLIWFFHKEDTIINGVDTNFPLNPIVWFLRRFFVWQDTLNGGSDFSSSTAGLFFHLIQVIPYSLGLNLPNTELLSVIFWFVIICVSSYIFARTIFSNKPLSQLIFVVLYCFNIYLFNSWENIKVANLSLIAAIPAGLTLLTLLKEKKISRIRAVFYICLTGIILSGTGINPAYFFTFLLILFIYALAQIIVERNFMAMVERGKDFLFLCLFIVLTNLFWILPTANFIFANIPGFGSIDRIGFTNWTDSLSENTSLFNIMRIQGAWDWYAFDGIGLPLYIPYALNYLKGFPFILFSCLLPALVIVSLFLRLKEKSWLYIAFGLMFITGVFLGAGTHLPTGYFYRWLIEHAPFFTLFRSPWYIFTPLVILSTAGLISLLSYNLEIKSLRVRYFKEAVFILGAILIIGNLFYSYPLVTGKIFRPGQPDNFYIKFPAYTFEAQRWLSKENGGRIISYPDDEIEKFNWGYRGIDSILTLLTNRQSLFLPLNLPDAPIANVIREFYEDLKKDQIESAKKIASKLNSSMVFNKRDQESLAPPLSNKFDAMKYVNFGPWYFYEFPAEKSLPKIYSSSGIFSGYPYLNGAKLLSVLDYSEILVDPSDSIVNHIPQIKDFSGNIIMTENSQSKEYYKFKSGPSLLLERLQSRDLSKVEFSFNILVSGIYKPVLERYHLEDFGLDLKKRLDIEIDNVNTGLDIDQITDSYVYFKPVQFDQGFHKLSLKLNNKNLITSGSFTAGSILSRHGNGSFQLEDGQKGKYLSILNKSNEDIYEEFPISLFDPMGYYLVQLKYMQIYGNNANVRVRQMRDTVPLIVQDERLPNYPDWNLFSFYFGPVKSYSTASVSLVAPQTKDPLGTKIFYSDLSVNKVFVNDFILVRDGNSKHLDSPNIEFKEISPVQYEATVKEAKNPHIIVFSENYSPFWDLTVYNNLHSKLTIKPLHFSTNLYANAWYIEGAPENYQVKIYYRPQTLFIIGLISSALTVIVAIILHFVFQLKKK